MSSPKFEQGSDTFMNSESAEVYGLEMEWKKGLADISEYLNGIRIGGNLTWSQSSVVLSELEKGLFLVILLRRATNILEWQTDRNEHWKDSQNGFIPSIYLTRMKTGVQ